MNIMQMMQQAQKMQKRLKEAQDELKELEIKSESANGAVEIVCDGQLKIKSIKLKPEAINPENPVSVDSDTVEMLEDIIIEAIKNAQDDAGKKIEERMKAVTGGVSIPGLF